MAVKCFVFRQELNPDIKHRYIGPYDTIICSLKNNCNTVLGCGGPGVA
jgi:hypothetical protein